MRKLFTLLIMLVIVSKANSQCTATITASSSTSPFCQGKGVILAANSNSNWTQKANLGRGNRNGAVGFSIGSKGYIGTGWINYCCDTLKNDFWEYDPTTNIWTQKADFAGGSGARGIGFSISSKGYIVWGKQLWEYNPTTNLWTRKADFGDAGFLDIGFSIGNKGYVASAFSSKHFWEYNPTTDIWTQKADFIGETRQGAVSFSIGSKGYIGTGWNTKYKKDFWEYDPITNVWTQKADFGGVGRFYAVGFSSGNKGYIGTGRDNYLRNDFWEYVPANDVWIQRASFIGASRTDAVGFSIGNKGFLGTGGQSSVPGFSDFYEYDPELKYLWSTGDTTSYITVSTSGKYSVKITNPAKGCSATSKPKVITFEPSPSATFLQSACGSYLWNNVKYTNSGTYTQIFADPRGCDSTATLILTIYPLPDSIITASGPTTFCEGKNVTLSTVANSNNNWIQKANFSGTARLGAVGFSICNKGYIGTGSDSTGLRNDFWEHNPVTNVWTQKANFAGTARSGTVGFSIGNRGYIGTGNDGSLKNDFWEYDPVNNVWAAKANFAGTPRKNAVGFSIGLKGFIGTGYDTSGNYKNDFWEYDPSTNKWTAKANYGGGATGFATGFTIVNKGFIGTGNDGSGTYKNDFWEYDTTANSWTQKANFSGGARVSAVGFSIGNYGYIGTGRSSATGTGNLKNDLWEYVPSTNTWTQKDNFSTTGRNGSVGFSIENKGYIGTGSDASGKYYNDLGEYHATQTFIWSNGANTPSIIASSNEFYKVTRINNATGCTTTSEPIVVSVIPLPLATITSTCSGILCQGDSVVLTAPYNNADAWSQRSYFGGSPRYGAVGFSIGSKGYIGTGSINYAAYADFWEYDPITNVWTQKADFGGGAKDMAVGFSIGNKGYIGTGYGNIDFWEYDPITNVWTGKTNFGGSGRSLAVGFSIGNKGYIGTGQGNISNIGNYLKKDFWEYDPSTNAWTQKADFAGAARSQAVGFSIGSKGYIGTGDTSGRYENSNDFWEYDPNTNIWTQKSNFTGTPRRCAVGFSIGRKGYIGTGNDGIDEKDFWQYNPITNTWIQKVDFGSSARSSAVGFSIDGKGYIGTGNVSGNLTKEFWQYYYTHEYLWSTGATTPSITAKASGSYTVTVTDPYTGCSATSAPTVVNIVGQPSITATYVVANSTCATAPYGGLQINATGGTKPYKYKLDTANENSYKASAIFKPLKAGIYNLNIKDSLGCFALVGPIIITSPPAIISSFTKTDATCIGKADGIINVAASGGKAPYGYKVGLAGNYNDRNIITGFSAGTYTVYIRDVNGCIGSTGLVTVGETNVRCLSKTANANAITEQNRTGIALVLTPNPSNGQFILQILAGANEVIHLRVFDINGRIILKSKGLPGQIFQFGNDFAPGTYLVEVRKGNEVKTIKAVKE